MWFRDPLWLLAAALPAALAWFVRRLQRPSLRFPTRAGLERLASAGSRVWTRAPQALRVLALLLIVVALARPQGGLQDIKKRAEGIDIVLVVDVSTSMLAEDFQLHGRRQNRLEVVKAVVKEFVEHRPDDRIGLVVFAGRPYTQCPLTLDHGWLLGRLDHVEIGMVEDGTAVGAGIATGLNRLRGSTAKSKVMIALTDGVNNAGSITPGSAAELAAALGVKVYTIGAGTKGPVPFPATDPFGRTVYQAVQIEVDDEGLTRIAQATGGRYFRATDTDSLRTIYEQIDRLEKTTVEQPQDLIVQEWYAAFLVPALGLVLLELALAHIWLRVLP